MEGIFFYWIAWMAWIVITFFMKKDKKRTHMAVFLLMVILFSNDYVTIGHLKINIALLILLIYGYLGLSSLNNGRLLYIVIICHIITLAYIGFTMYRLYDPVVQWFHPTWMTAILLFFLVQILIKPFSLRCLVMMISICHGSLLYTWMMSQFSLAVGSLALFDLLAAGFLLLMLWHGFQKFSLFLKHSLTTTYQPKRQAVLQSEANRYHYPSKAGNR